MRMSQEYRRWRNPIKGRDFHTETRETGWPRTLPSPHRQPSILVPENCWRGGKSLLNRRPPRLRHGKCHLICKKWHSASSMIAQAFSNHLFTRAIHPTIICRCSFEQKSNMFLQNKKNTLNVTFYNVIFKTCNHCNINDSQHHQLQKQYFPRYHS